MISGTNSSKNDDVACYDYWNGKSDIFYNVLQFLNQTRLVESYWIKFEDFIIQVFNGICLPLRVWKRILHFWIGIWYSVRIILPY